MGIAALRGLTTGRDQNLGEGGATGMSLIGEARETGLAEWKPESTLTKGRRSGMVIWRGGSGHDRLGGRFSRYRSESVVEEPRFLGLKVAEVLSVGE